MKKFFSNESNEIHHHSFAKVKFCNPKNLFSFTFSADGYFPDRQNCRVYHICTSGVDTAAVCAEGTAWDPIKKNCGWENTVECKKGLRKWDQITDIRGGRREVMGSMSVFSDQFLVTLFATDAAFAWRAKKSTTTRATIKVDSNFTCEYDGEGYFPGTQYFESYSSSSRIIPF